jgi:hypothetical protein
MLLLFDFNQNQNAVTNFNKNPKYEIREHFWRHPDICRWTDMTTLTVTFCS